jgi:lipopolysaccharide transport system ATP-binding protein
MPTTGSIKTKGRIASLLEVGTGFHPELTGRENIYLNGAILGMTKAEIKAKEDEIIDFSGCAMYIDTPVKRYSSGMRVRLAFAVAAHLEPDILVVDEVLAVGDAEFQKKAIGKMKDISGTGGRTVLFVSHNMAAVKSLCTRGVVLENGTSVFEGTADESVDYYLSSSSPNEIEIKERKDRTGSGKIKLTNFSLFNSENLEIESVISGEYLRVRLFFETNIKTDNKLVFAMSIKDQNEVVKSMIVSDELGIDINNLIKRGFIQVDFKKLLLRGGLYNVTILISENSTNESDHLDKIDNAFKINVLPGDFYNKGKINRSKASAIIPCEIL